MGGCSFKSCIRLFGGMSSNDSKRDGHLPPDEGPRKIKSRSRARNQRHKASPMKVAADQMSSNDNGPENVKAKAEKINEVQEGKVNQEAGRMKAATPPTARMKRKIRAKAGQGKEAANEDLRQFRMKVRQEVEAIMKIMKLNMNIKRVNYSVAPWVECGDVPEEHFPKLHCLYEPSSDPRNYGNLFEKVDGKFVPFFNVGPQYPWRRQGGKGTRPGLENTVPDPRNSYNESNENIKSVSQPLASFPEHPLGITGTGLQAPPGTSQAGGPPPSAANGLSTTSLFDRYPFSFHPDLMNESQFSQPPPIRDNPPASPASVLRSFPLCEEAKPFHEARPETPPMPVANQNLGSTSPNQAPDMVPFNQPQPFQLANQNLGPALSNQTPAGGNVPTEFDTLLNRIQEVNERMKEFQTLQEELKRKLESGFAPTQENHSGPSQSQQPQQ